MKMAEFMRQVRKSFPLATIETDNDGQLLIYTGLTVAGGMKAGEDDLVVLYDDYHKSEVIHMKGGSPEQ